MSLNQNNVNRELSELKRTNARLSQLMANLQGGVLVEDETRHITLVNQAFCDLFNISVPPSALIGMDCSNSAEENKSMFTNPDKFVHRISVILQERQSVTNETLFLVDGRVFSRDYVPVFYTDEYIGHLWHYRDVTDEHLSRQRWTRILRFELVNREINRLFLQVDDIDEALNQALATSGQLLDVSRAYTFRFRENEHILDNTHEWCAPGVTPEIDNLQGLLVDKLIPSFFPMMAVHDLIAPEHIRDLPPDLQGILEPQNIETVLWIPLYLHNRIAGMVGYDEVRRTRKWLPEEIGMVRNIAESYARALERKHAEQMLIKARDEAIRTAELRTQFVANMSHEIRTPMTGALGMLELLLETELNHTQREFASEAFNSSSRLLAIINNILDFSKLESGQIVLDIGSIDVKSIVNEVKMTLAPRINNKEIQVEVDFDPNLPYRFFGDATRIRQVLMNLADNAIKFTHEGQISLGVEVDHILDEVAYLRFLVKDTGIGIAKDKLDHIFESFVQADGSTTRKYGGSGLGLSICKQLVEIMGGTISAESQPGEGSTFSFMLGLPIARTEGLTNPVHVHFSDLKVLIIDDNKTVQYVLAQQLRNWGVQTSEMQELKELKDLQSESDEPVFDIMFKRYRRKKDETETLKLLPTISKRLVYILDSKAKPKSKEHKSFNWPMDQSTLYSLLVEAAHEHIKSTSEAASTTTKEVRGRVLVADDYPLNIELIQKSLAELNVHVDDVSNGQQALDMLEQETYDLILMDIQMPILDGIEATRRIRESDKAYRDIPILALTASVMTEQTRKYRAAGMNEIIGKPFSVRELRDTVQKWLQKSDNL